MHTFHQLDAQVFIYAGNGVGSVSRAPLKRTAGWMWQCSPQNPVWRCIMSTSFTDLPVFLCFSSSHSYPSSPFSSPPPPPHRADRPLIPPCRIITTSPPDPTSAPCICPTRGGVEAATIASTRRGPYSPTGRGPSTSTSTSPTGRPLLGTPAAAFHLLCFSPCEPSSTGDGS